MAAFGTGKLCRGPWNKGGGLRAQPQERSLRWPPPRGRVGRALSFHRGPEVTTGTHGCRARAPGAGEKGRIRRSCDVGVGGFILVTLGCWFHCRYNFAKQRIQERIAREGIKNKILYESTHLDPERKLKSSSNS
ncbi:uncharacterized protein LOC101986729 isoform X1 [Microtus ochrogaster]|uniref:Cytochrome c oxidase assembly protein COX20, mitochondrial n=1 Tax=Microtus ochrogaster TaxID=79684 RepID=A0ABM1U0T1_MICOH|nr:uncharacterized protein LOC101986729 isoform X1 [Microtus ochrogaster]